MSRAEDPNGESPVTGKILRRAPTAYPRVARLPSRVIAQAAPSP